MFKMILHPVTVAYGNPEKQTIPTPRMQPVQGLLYPYTEGVNNQRLPWLRPSTAVRITGKLWLSLYRYEFSFVCNRVKNRMK